MKALIEKYKSQFKEIGKSFLYGFGGLLGTALILAITAGIFPHSLFYVFNLIALLRFTVLGFGIVGIGKAIRKGLGE